MYSNEIPIRKEDKLSQVNDLSFYLKKQEKERIKNANQSRKNKGSDDYLSEINKIENIKVREKKLMKPKVGSLRRSILYH